MNDFLEQQSRGWILAVGLLATLLVGALDYILPDDVTLFAFYLGAVLFVARYGGWNHAVLLSVVSSLIWWFSRHDIHNYEAMLWKGVNRCGAFVVVAIGGAAMRAQRNSLRERIALLEERRELEAEILRAGEREQMRIGQDLHDGLCQHLAAIDCAVACLKDDLQQESPAKAEAADFIHEQLKGAIQEARSIARGIFPVPMTQEGFLSAVLELVEVVRRAQRARVTVDAPAELSFEDPGAGLHLFRILQEALNNAVRHSEATEIHVSLRSQENGVTLEVIDNGVGLKEPKSNGMGLRTMRYRAEQIGAKLSFVARGDGCGTIVTCSARRGVEPRLEGASVLGEERAVRERESVAEAVGSA